jgi:hypothetical protein
MCVCDDCLYREGEQSEPEQVIMMPEAPVTTNIDPRVNI